MRFLRVAFLIGLLLITAIAVPWQLFDHQGVERVKRLQQEKKSLIEANQRIKRDNETLRQQIYALHADPEYVEKTARDELGMVGADEIIYQFPNDAR